MLAGIGRPLTDCVSTVPEDWGQALNQVIPAVVVLRVTACRSFDTQSAGASSATGFVVDKTRGIILTNRHVVKPGPVVAEAIFVNREEIPVYPLYRDPVHDFGFFRYDPDRIQYLDYESIPLAPEAASVGLEIRVVGNDSGEKVSILAGTIARLDRDAPQYKTDGYNDFNTFYVQAASGTKGGSSGSPVINCQGSAVALNAGSKSLTSSAFYLPLDRVVRALRYLQDDGKKTNPWDSVAIPRGTLQVTFKHKGFDEARRLGLRTETEEMVRRTSPSGETGMLTVDSVVPGGPSHKHLKVGDLLIRVDGSVITRFLRLEEMLDENVGKNVELQIERGGHPATLNLVVQDLHSITPDHFLEVSGAVLHPLSYQQARNFRFPCGLVYVAKAGYVLSRAGICKHAIIRRFAGEEIEKLEELILILSRTARGSRVPLEYITHKDRHRRRSVLVTIDRHDWYPGPQVYTRDDRLGLWTPEPAFPCVSSSVHDVAARSEGIEEGRRRPVVSLTESGDDLLPENRSSAAEGLVEPSLVMVDVHVPTSCMVDGVHSKHFTGTGVVVHQSPTAGLVVVDRNTVAVSASDVTLSFAAVPLEITGDVVFLHPHHNFAVVAYDPCALGPAGALAVRPGELLPEPALCRGDAVYLVGLSGSSRAMSRRSVVTDAHSALDVAAAQTPRYRAVNAEVIKIDTDFGSKFSGALVDERGRVRAIWSTFSTQSKSGVSTAQSIARGVPIRVVEEVLRGIVGGTLLVRVLEVELFPTPLSEARSFGLGDGWVDALAREDPIRRQVLRVRCCFAGSKAERLLEQGDMVLAVDGKPVTCFRDVEVACRDGDGSLRMTVLRKGRETELRVGTDLRDGNGTTRLMNWCGCVVHDPHPAVRALGFLPEEGHGVYVAKVCKGSPAHRYGLGTLHWIVEVNGTTTPDLDAFAKAVRDVGREEFVRVKTVHLNGKPGVVTLKQDLHYWPAWELTFHPDSRTWHRQVIISTVGDAVPGMPPG